jgi:hypothetical protein
VSDLAEYVIVDASCAHATKTFVIEIASAVLFLTAVAFSITGRAARTA